MLEAWYERGVLVADWAPRTRANARWVLDKHLVRLGRVPLNRLTVEHVDDLVHGMVAAKVSPHTVSKARNALSAALNLAIRRRQLPPGQNVARIVEIPSTRRRPPTALAPEQVPAFIEAVGRHRLGPLFIVAMALALRPSEAFGLRWEDVDLEAGRVTIRQTIQATRSGGIYETRDTKTHRERTIAIPAQVVVLLRAHREQQRQTRVSPLVFPNTVGGPTGKWSTVVLRRLLREAGLPEVTMYQLRHSGATLRLAMGVPLAVVQEDLGHSSIAMTRRYAQVVEPLRRASAAAIDDLFRATGGTAGGTGRPDDAPAGENPA